MTNLIYLLVGIICTAVGLLAIFIGLKSYRTGKESLHWPTVEGEIISSELIERWRQPPDSSSRIKEWLAHIVYEYRIDGIKYVSTQIKLSPHSWGSKMSAKKLVSKYNDGRLVPVYHHPTVREAEKVTELSKNYPKLITMFITLPEVLADVAVLLKTQPLVHSQSHLRGMQNPNPVT